MENLKKYEKNIISIIIFKYIKIKNKNVKLLKNKWLGCMNIKDDIIKAQKINTNHRQSK